MTGAEIYNRVVKLNQVINVGEETIKFMDRDSLSHVLVVMGLIAAKKELHRLMEAKYKEI